MIGNHLLVVVGNLTSDPELKFSEGGTPFAKFSIACNDGRRDDPKAKTAYYRLTAFNDVAENIVETLHKGDAILATLRIDPWMRKIQTEDGEKEIQQIDYTVDEIGPSLRFASAKISKNQRNNDRGDDRGDDRNDRGSRGGSDRSSSRSSDRGERDERPADRGDDREEARSGSSRGGSSRGGSSRTSSRGGRGDQPNF